MPDRRLQIQKALENLKANERAADFESLACHLAKRRHPTLVVTERKSDGGEDLTSFVADEQGRRIRGAVSLTGTWEKIRKDAQRQRNLKATSDLLVFVTTEAIAHLEIKKWCEKFLKKFGYELAVIGQADLINELEKPENEWLCADYLGIDPLCDALGTYLDFVIERSDKLLLAGIDPKSSDPATCKRLDLANVYIGLSTGLRRPLREGEKSRRRAMEGMNVGGETAPVSALEAAANHSRLVLTGHPGSGKTTFIRHLCLCLAQYLKTHDGHWLERLRTSGWTTRPLVPIVVELRAFARSLPATLDAPPEAGALWKFFASLVLEESQLHGHVDGLLRVLESGRALVIFEGLDEVPTGTQRAYVRSAIEAFAGASRFRASRILVTCRSRAYASNDLKLVDRSLSSLPQFAEAPLEDFDRVRIRSFTESWYRELARLDTSLAGSVGDRAERLFTALQAPALWPHAGRPMLLTVMANVHARNDRLPHERAQVYAEMIQILVESWDSVRLLDQAPLRRLLEGARKTHKDLIEFLSGLAYAAHAGNRTRAAGRDALADIPKHGPDGLLETLARWSGSRDRAADLIEAIEQRAGLLVSPDPGAAVFQFPHRSFQEYLAGVYLADQDDFEERAVLLITGVAEAGESADDSGYWDETVKWAVGWIAHVAEGQRRWKEIPIVADKLCQHRLGSPAEIRHRRILAAEILTEMGADKLTAPRTVGGAACLDRVQQLLLEQLADGERVPAKERCESGRVLGWLGDPRPGVAPRSDRELGEMEFCRIPPHPFWMGLDAQSAKEVTDRYGIPQESLRRQDALPYEYWIARHPVTVAQFNRFVEAKGYAEQEWWPEAIQAGLWKDGTISSRTYDLELAEWVEENRTRPGDSGAAFRTPNHPVVGITWYESMAFCRWLNERWPLDLGLRLRLPSEAEWELATRGGIRIPKRPQIQTLATGLLAPRALELVENATEQRQYPWGEIFDPNTLNTQEGQVEGTSAAGCFGQGVGPYGAADMAGNVWEWTRSLWGEDWRKPEFSYPYRADGRENEKAPSNVLRVLRGGSWDDPAGGARCGYRGRNVPGNRDALIGFRLVASPFVSGR